MPHTKKTCLYQWKPDNGPALLTVTLLVHKIYSADIFELAADDQDENEFRLEKIGQLFCNSFPIG